MCRLHVNNVQMRHAEKTINTDYLANHLHDSEMKQLNILVTNSIQQPVPVRVERQFMSTLTMRSAADDVRTMCMCG